MSYDDNFIGPASKFQEDYLNADEQIILVGGAAGCLPYETEVLTDRGWIPIGEWKGQSIGAVELDLENKDHAVLRYENPKRYIKLPCESMRCLESSRFSMTLSDEHRVPYFYPEERLNKVFVESFSNILDRHEASKNKGFSGRFHTALSGMVGGKGLPLNEWELRLQVAAMADGSFSEKGANNYCIIKVSKERKSKRLEYLCSMGGLSLRKMPTTYSDRYTNGKIDTYVVHPKLRQKRFEGIFWDATYEQLQIIVDEISHWDGSVVDGQKSGSTVRYFSKYKSDADFIQYASTVCGRAASIVKDEREGKEAYTVNITRVKSRSFANKDGKCPIKTVKTSDGYKYCFETSTGFFLVREKGRIYVTGNSSKSYIGLMRHLRFVEDPNYRAYCIRKNSSAIMSSGGLFDEAVELYRKYEPSILVKLKDQKIVFPSKAEVSFSHYENDQAANKYQGIQISNIFYDEITHSPNEEQFWWLWSRLRSKAKNVHSFWASCNPDPDSWVFKFALPYLYPEGHELAGRPDPDKNGNVRYLLRIGGEIVWGETPEELQERYGYDKRPISFRALFGTIDDNPPLQKTNPDYKQNLEALPTVERERLLYGNWFARPENSSYYSRSNMPELVEVPSDSEFSKIVRAYDFAGTLPHDGNRETDYFASVKMGKLHSGNYVILDVVRTRITFGDWERHILENAARDGEKVEIILPQDPNAAAKAATSLLARTIIEYGYIVRTKRSSMGKLDSFRPFAAAVENGSVSIVKGCCTDLWNKINNDNDFFHKELEAFDGKRRGGAHHDDMVDCCSLAFSTLAQRVHIPNILSGLSSADLRVPNPFNR